MAMHPGGEGNALQLQPVQVNVNADLVPFVPGARKARADVKASFEDGGLAGSAGVEFGRSFGPGIDVDWQGGADVGGEGGPLRPMHVRAKADLAKFVPQVDAGSNVEVHASYDVAASKHAVDGSAVVAKQLGPLAVRAQGAVDSEGVQY